ncbi:2-amino-3,7-dideoxy-D-threo-hept-6-ulosonate synthase [Salinactinospora qingdaonensis]|uniref:2-amino-3,7-dideoxy-D-threo-hept-6-ulosonate synthase n=1 Tax=Salinactinospora qingdaonensis TaxID=702744 RepID=A0ABP7GJK1_9ACTN
MITYQPSAAKLRLLRLYHHDDSRLFVVPLDHSVSDGPAFAGHGLDPLIGQLVSNGVDAIVLHKGRIRHVHPRWFTKASLIVHLSASTRHAVDPDAKYLVASVESALRLGADAVSVHVNLGSREESQQIADLGAVADACAQWNLPLLAMMYPRGPEISNPHDPELLAHALSLATDMGADIVKIPAPQSGEEMADLVRECAIPVLGAGGAPRNDTAGVMSYVSTLLTAGATGVAMGRNVFGAPNPGLMARRVADLVHSPIPRLRSPRSAAELTGSAELSRRN